MLSNVLDFQGEPMGKETVATDHHRESVRAPRFGMRQRRRKLAGIKPEFLLLQLMALASLNSYADANLVDLTRHWHCNLKVCL